MPAKLSNNQKRILSQLSDRAFRFLGAKARGRQEAWPDDNTANRAQFRHDQVAKCCGKAGLRCCSQDDYKAVEAHLYDLLGETGRAFNAHVRAETNHDRVAEFKLHAEIRAWAHLGITVSYVQSICRAKYKCTLLETSAKQKWALLYDVRRTARARIKRGNV